MPDKPIKVDVLDALLAGDAATPELRQSDTGPVYLCEIVDALAGNRAAARIAAAGYTPRAYGLNLVVAADLDAGPGAGVYEQLV